ncbi:MAG TPA: ATP-dependent DNA helicase RecG, partial [Chthoniobacteraceae bacterium]|nr:ATP-dependent DNA helicase RecG [Chthoniobacteraceae bacterium]
MVFETKARTVAEVGGSSNGIFIKRVAGNSQELGHNLRGRVSSCGLAPLSSRTVNLETALAEIDWLLPQRVRQLERFGLRSVEDLLTHFPKRYEDRTRFDRFPVGETAEPVCVCGIVKRATVRRIRGRQKMFDVLLEEENPHALSAPLICRWFNSHWVEKMIAHGQRLVVFGKPRRAGTNVVIAHPEFEVIEEGAGESVHLNRLAPIHRATEGLSTRVLRQIVWDVLERLLDDEVPEVLPRELDAMPRAWALRQIHFPDSADALEKARRHLVLTEFFTMQVCVAARRAEQLGQAGAAHAGPGTLMRRVHEALPFPLTGAQHRAIAEIAADLAAPRPMNRLLHGDVGSGKTLVALSAMLLCVESGQQAALMAPTQILAEQHYLNFRRLLEPLGLSIALRTGARREEAGLLPLFGAAVGDSGNSSSTPQILVGTHALLYEGAGVEDLGLAVIDEQHKFGVMQRARLRNQSAAPDVLVMTATPIPRTLTMTLYGDLDVSTLDEMPRNRGKIITAVREPAKLPDAVKFLREQLASGRQAYIVYPLIDESEKLEAKAAATEFAKWREMLAPFSCELLHGRIPPDEKEATMQRFRRGETQALIATTVIEVGIDVPNATLMLIENAERFGLAQLHQLRGRIGRGEHKSYCILLSASDDAVSLEKLRILERTSDGFEIAEADLRLRGPGDILGTAQSGLPPLKIGDPVADHELMR